MSFADLMRKPLPSSEGYFSESEDDYSDFSNTDNSSNEPSDDYPANDSNTLEEECDSEECELDSDDVENLDDIDISDLSDEELSQLEEDIADSDIDDAVGDEPEVRLSPDEEKEADDLMSLSATTELIRSELSSDDQKKFYESTDAQIAVYEGFLLESDLYTDDDLVTEATRRIFQKTRVQFSKKDRLAQLFAVAVNVSAKAHNDPLYTRYQKILKIRRVTRAKLRKKYKAEAVRRMKVYYQRLKNSKSPVLNKIADKAELPK